MSEINTEALPPEPKPSARVASVDVTFGHALTRRNSDLLDIQEEPTEADALKRQQTMLAFLPQMARSLFQQKPVKSNEYAATSNKPVELKPPVPLESLERVIRECPELSRAIAAITVGVASRGFHLPAKNTEHDATNEAEVKAELEDLQAWVQHMCPNRSFSQVMKITVSNRKRFAFAAWEILRNQAQQVIAINPIEDCKTVKWYEQDTHFTPVERQIQVGDRVETETFQRKFRRFAQKITSGPFGVSKKTTYFKEFGDPRRLNSKTGEYWTSVLPPGPDFPDATELLIFPVVDSGGEFPVPEWLPILPDALASRAIRVINLDTLNNGATPPFLVIIEGTVDDAQMNKIIDQFKDIQGQTSRRRAIFVQVDSTTVGAGTAKDAVTPTVKIEPMAQLMTTEGMFLKYLSWLERSISSALRLPLVLVGNIDLTLTRANAEAALIFAEDQVFGPERQDIEDVLNDQLLPEVVLYRNRLANIKGVKHHRLKLGSYNADKSQDYIKLLLAEKGAMSINERRQVIDTILPDQKLPAVKDEKADTPLGLLASKIPGMIPMPEDSQITQGIKAQISREYLQGRPISQIYYKEAA